MSRLALVLAVVIAGCRQPPRPPPRASADSPENQATLDKLQTYLDCLSEHSARVFQIADAYRQRQGERPAGSEAREVVEPSRDPATCIQAIARARKQKPPLPEIEAAADRFAAAAQRVFTATAAAHRYLDPAGASHDLARATAAQPELLAAFHEFDVAQAALFDQVYRVNRKIHLDQVARLEQRDGRTLPVRAEIMMLRAEDLVRFAATPSDQLDKLDAAAFTTVLDELQDAVEDTTSFASTHPKEASDLNKFWAMVDDAKAYVAAAKQLVQRAQAHLPYSDAEKLMIGASNEASIVGSPQALARAYNTLVEDFAHL